MDQIYYNLNGFHTSCTHPELPYTNPCLPNPKEMVEIVRLTNDKNIIDLVSTQENFYLVNATNIGSEELLYTVSRSDANLNYQIDTIAHLRFSQEPDDFRATVMFGTPEVDIIVNDIPTDMDIHYNWSDIGFVIC